MLDVAIRSTKYEHITQLYTELFDKRRAPEYSTAPIIRYPHASSLLSKSCKYSILVSRFHHLRRIISTRTNFVSELATIFLDLMKKGYDPKKLHSRLGRCLRFYPGLYPATSNLALRWLFYLALLTQATADGTLRAILWARHQLSSMHARYRYLPFPCS